MFNQFIDSQNGQSRNERNARSGKGSGLGRGGGRGRGQGSGNKPGSGPGGDCVCPKCGHREAHLAGERCIDRVCPKCGTKMIRE